MAAAFLAVGASCDEPQPTPATKTAPRAGEFVKLRGVLSEDVDCRVLRAEDGTEYSLNIRLPNYINGARLCVHGTILETSHCLVQPTIEVTSVRAWSSCP
jgi:hypothetical protein